MYNVWNNLNVYNNNYLNYKQIHASVFHIFQYNDTTVIHAFRSTILRYKHG